MRNKALKIHDCTLREGLQAQGIWFSVDERVEMIKLFDDAGFHMVEIGYPFSNKTDFEFAKRVEKMRFKHVTPIAFGRTAKLSLRPGDDESLQCLASIQLPAYHVFGKAWDLHVTEALKITLEENLDTIFNTIHWLKSRCDEVSFGAEHFFEGFFRNREYALKILAAAADAGVDWIDLPDTNGSFLPEQIYEGVAAASKAVKVPLAVHCHNDCGLAVANTVAAVKAGATIIEGTVNGYGERCGITDLCTIVPLLQVKFGYQLVAPENLVKFTGLASSVASYAGVSRPLFSPFVGRYAFTHKAGTHANAQAKSAVSYQHMDPALVGNNSHFSVSQMAGLSNLKKSVEDCGLASYFNDGQLKVILEEIKERSAHGYCYDIASASLELFLNQKAGRPVSLFEIERADLLITYAKSFYSIEASLGINIQGEHVTHQFKSSELKLIAALKESLNELLTKRIGIPNFGFSYKTLRISRESHRKSDLFAVVSFLNGGHLDWTTVGVSESLIQATKLSLSDAFNWYLLHSVAGNHGRFKAG